MQNLEIPSKLQGVYTKQVQRVGYLKDGKQNIKIKVNKRVKIKNKDKKQDIRRKIRNNR